MACIIEDEPREEYGSSRGPDRELDIKFDHEGYPTAPWKSPFYAFLQINADAVLGFLHQLVDFATERWVRYALGRAPVDVELPTVATLSKAFLANGGDVHALLVDIVTSPTFRMQRVEGN